MEYIYVLKCQKDKFFIWKTYNVQIEYNEHLDGTFCDMTKEFKPYDIDCIFEVNENIILEMIIARYINKYSASSIYFINEVNKKEIKKYKKNNNCICGNDHFLTECNLNTKDQFWTKILNKVVNKLNIDFQKYSICCRCGRYGHDIDECYSKTHIEGFSLSDSEDGNFIE